MDVHLTDTVLCDRAFPLRDGGWGDHGIPRGIHFWWPKITGRMYNEGWSKISAIIIFIGSI